MSMEGAKKRGGGGNSGLLLLGQANRATRPVLTDLGQQVIIGGIQHRMHLQSAEPGAGRFGQSSQNALPIQQFQLNTCAVQGSELVPAATKTAFPLAEKGGSWGYRGF